MKKAIIIIILFITIRPYEKTIIPKFINLNKSLKSSLTSAWYNITSKKESIIINKNKNIILIKGSLEQIKEFENVFKSIDKERKCVSISIQSGAAEIVDSFNFGINEFGVYNKNPQIARENKKFSFTGIGAQLIEYPTPTNGIAANLAVDPEIPNINLNQNFTSPNSSIVDNIYGNIITEPAYLNIPFTLGGPDLNLARLSPTLNTLIKKDSTDTKINSTFIIKDREKLTLKSGDSLPLYSQNTVSANDSFLISSGLKYIDLGIKLELVPILDKKLEGVTLHIYLEIDILIRGSVKPQGFLIDKPNMLENPPVLDKRKVEQIVYIKNNESILISDYAKSTKNKELRKVPFFSKIPLLGKLFQSTLDKNEELDQFILITPKIIK